MHRKLPLRATRARPDGRGPTIWKRRAAASLIALGLSALWPAVQADSRVAADVAASRPFAISPGPLTQALGQFAAQAGVSVTASSELTQGRTSPGLQGVRSVAEALRALLQGTDLQAVDQGDGAYVLQPAPAGATLLPAVKVDASAAAETASGPVDGYVARRSATGTKTDTPLIETPQSVTVVTRQQMDVQNVQSLEQAVAYSAGISPLSGGGGNGGTSGTGFTMRGFNVTGSAPLYLNGTRFSINSLSGPEEPYLYERIELLKGPASVLYGQAAPGGVINLVSKRPTDTPFRELEVQFDTWNRRQVNADVAGPINASGTLGYRLTGFLRDSDTMIEDIANDRSVASGALSWKPGEKTSLLLLASYMDNQTAYDYGKPFDGTNLPNPNGRIERDLFVGEPGADFFDTYGYTAGYLFEHRFSEHWQVRQNLLRFDRQTDSLTIGISNRTDEETRRTVNRFVYTRDDSDDGVSVDTQVQGKLRHGAFQHTLLLGLDYGERRFERAQGSGTVAPLDVFEPVYGAPVTLNAANSLSVGDTDQIGVYAQDHVKFDDRWIVLLGARWDETETRSNNVSAAGVPSQTRNRQDAMTYRAGLLYLFDNGLAPYASWTESFQPQSGFDYYGNAFEPTTGEQYEVGLKLEPRDLNAALTVALYEITRENVLTRDPDHATFSVQLGEVRSRGVEVEGRANLTRAVDLIAAYAYTDAEITRSNNGDEGRVPTSTPRHTASLWLDYGWLGGALDGLGASAGVRNVGKSFSQDNSFTVPSYTVYDAALRYLFGPWRFSLNVKNLFDKEYVGACTFSCFYGDERSVAVSARYTW